MRIRDLGYAPGKLPTGPKNSILDIPGVHVGQVTIAEGGDDVLKGVTVILPRDPDNIDVPCYAGMHTLNGNGEVTGCYQIKDWGYVNTPIALTNSLSLGVVFQGAWKWKLDQQKRLGQNLYAMSRNYGTPVVGETADWGLNDIYRSTLEPEHVAEAFERALTQEEVLEGQQGGGASMTCHQFAGGTGTSSRVIVGAGDKTYHVAALVQSNYGHTEDLNIGGVPVGKLLLKEAEDAKKAEPEASLSDATKLGGGSIVIMLFTDAPMAPHQLVRLAQRAGVGLACVGGHGVGRTHSGDIFLAVSTANHPNEQLDGPKPSHKQPQIEINTIDAMKNECVDAIFRGAAEATEEAILNSLVGGRAGRKGFEGSSAQGLPVDKVKEYLDKYMVTV